MHRVYNQYRNQLLFVKQYQSLYLLALIVAVVLSVNALIASVLFLPHTSGLPLGDHLSTFLRVLQIGLLDFTQLDYHQLPAPIHLLSVIFSSMLLAGLWAMFLFRPIERRHYMIIGIVILIFNMSIVFVLNPPLLRAISQKVALALTIEGVTLILICCLTLRIVHFLEKNAL
jgi:hypothetical protein